MARLRKKDRSADIVETPEVEPVLGVRHRGPWDSSERSAGNDPAYIDLGALKVRGDGRFEIQLPTDGESDDIGSVVLLTEDAAVEVRAFAATRSGGMWDEIRVDLEEEVERLGGERETIDGPFGQELRIRVPVEMPDGENGFQPSRIVGIEGPRWLLRATFLGEAGLNPSDEGVLFDALCDIIVVRGSEARIAREALLLTLPEGASEVEDEG